MRDIKFNAVEEEIGDYIIYNNWLIENHSGAHTDNDDLSLFLEYYFDYKLLQYTGLKDKNGVEIYEEDFIEDNQYLFVMKWQAGGFVLSPVRYSKNVPYIGKQLAELQTAEYISQSCEVVGNIYENPELLEK